MLFNKSGQRRNPDYWVDNISKRRPLKVYLLKKTTNNWQLIWFFCLNTLSTKALVGSAQQAVFQHSDCPAGPVSLNTWSTKSFLGSAQQDVFLHSDCPAGSVCLYTLTLNCSLVLPSKLYFSIRLPSWFCLSEHFKHLAAQVLHSKLYFSIQIVQLVLSVCTP
jgi:hypothetical protein